MWIINPTQMDKLHILSKFWVDKIQNAKSVMALQSKLTQRNVIEHITGSLEDLKGRAQNHKRSPHNESFFIYVRAKRKRK